MSHHLQMTTRLFSGCSCLTSQAVDALADGDKGFNGLPDADSIVLVCKNLQDVCFLHPLADRKQHVKLATPVRWQLSKAGSKVYSPE